MPLNRHSIDIFCYLMNSVDTLLHNELPIDIICCCSYERHAILEWFSACASNGRRPSSPMTGEEIRSGDVTSNLALKSRIQVGQGCLSAVTAHEIEGSGLPAIDVSGLEGCFVDVFCCDRL